MSLYLDKIETGLTREEMQHAMRQIMDGGASENEIEKFLVTLADRGESVDEITGAATVMREKALTIKAPKGAVDCCGTGGDGTGTYNISTAVALVSAACGVPVAKHGNRASSSKSGAADVLEALGVNLDVPVATLEGALQKFDFCFLMAPNHHKAMRHVSPVRKRLGRRTIFNLLGPLSSPAGAKRQLVGVFDKKWVLPLAEVLKNLGAESAWVVHGSDGLDEITVTGPTYAAILSNGTITEKEITPADFGLKESLAQDLRGGGAKENAVALLAMLEGARNAYRDVVIANTAAVLSIHSGNDDLKHNAGRAARAIDDGVALKTLEDYRDFTQKIEL
jgi:anthranilate phosphoribosyltransferase